MTRKPSPPEPCTLVAKIVSMERDYYISEHREHERPVGDEAHIEIVGRIEQITRSLKVHAGREIEISLMCSRAFQREEQTPTADRPFLLPMHLRKALCGFSAYLPSDAFWAIPSMISSGEVTHIEARFEVPRRGYGTLLSFYLGPLSKITPVT